MARIEWADGQMPVLRSIRERFAASGRSTGVRVGACLHVTAETANLVRALAAGGARGGAVLGQPADDPGRRRGGARGDGVEVRAARGEDADAVRRHVAALADREPQVTLDDGADLVIGAAASAGRRARRRPRRRPPACCACARSSAPGG